MPLRRSLEVSSALLQDGIVYIAKALSAGFTHAALFAPQKLLQVFPPRGEDLILRIQEEYFADFRRHQAVGFVTACFGNAPERIIP